MANAATRELRELEPEEVERRLQEAQTELINLRFGLATLQTQNTARLSQVKRQIARIKTLIHEREMEA
jgi:large subunit ribosomal protein L29